MSPCCVLIGVFTDEEPICARDEKEIFQAEGYLFMGAAFAVYNDRGYGMAEEIYQECLEIELELRRIAFQSKPELRCHYKGRELKAVTQLAPEHEAQLINYLRITRSPVGYLLNFGHKDTLE